MAMRIPLSDRRVGLPSPVSLCKPTQGLCDHHIPSYRPLSPYESGSVYLYRLYLQCTEATQALWHTVPISSGFIAKLCNTRIPSRSMSISICLLIVMVLVRMKAHLAHPMATPLPRLASCKNVSQLPPC